jgi:hypothetical protein
MALVLPIAIAAVLLTPPRDVLRESFQKPPLSARPHTWWHWMNGNVTKEGITADLEAMREVGIGGAQMFTVDQGIPAGDAPYMGTRWRELTAWAVKEAYRFGIELCIHNCAGWSSSGGPWIQPADAMQVLAWSTLEVTGGDVNVELAPVRAPQIVTSVPYSKDIAVFAIAGSPTLAAGGEFLGRTGVNRQDGLMPNLAPKSGVAPSQVLDVTRDFKDGVLKTTLPAGTWTILRLGHVPTGKDNHPAPPEGDGLEVDKLSRSALDKHWAGMMAKVIQDVGPLAGKTLNNSLIDSYEVGSQNWTPTFRNDFKRLRGYDPMPYMPALAGIVVESGPITERFLWDYRRTIADLYARNYFGYFGELCHRQGMQFSTEPYGNGGFDNIQAGGTADIPMGEFWLGGMAMESTKLASSIGHVYGRRIVGAESFTADDVRGRFLEEPYMMKTVGDLALVNGVNRYIFHRYAQQPWTKYQPGMTMGPWGTHLERTQTWWKEAATWLQYVARCQSLLQQGRFVADAVVYTGESAPADLPYGRGGSRIVPEGYDYDGCDTKILMSMTVRNGKIVLPSGMSYRLLVLPKSEFMTPPVARKIKSLVRDGAIVVGPKPLHTPSLVGYPASENEVVKLGNEVWGSGASNKFGKGQVFRTATPAEVLDQIQVKPDFSYTGDRARLLHIHRVINGADVYFVSNQRNQNAIANCTFRVTGKQPELWHPETGKTELAPIWSDVEAVASDPDIKTHVQLRLKPAESVFVVFRNKPKGQHLSVVEDVIQPAAAKQPITILSARYQTADGRGFDVSAKVRDLVAHGDTEVEATNSNFGDPVVNVVKRLDVEYQVGKQRKKVSVAENESLLLGSGGPIASVTDLDVEANGRDRISVYAWKKGRWRMENNCRLMTLTSIAPATIDLSRNWTAAFAPKLGAPATAAFPKVTAWNEHANPGIKYFSGSANYTKTFNYTPPKDNDRKRVRLDLGDVKNFATVTLNGKPLGTLWKPPFIVDVTDTIKPGDNKLEIKVTNLWVNRIIGDEQLPPDVEWNGTQLKAWPQWLVNNEPRPKTGRITFTTWKFWDKKSPLQPSGLIGPVKLQTAYGIVIESKPMGSKIQPSKRSTSGGKP